MVNEQDLKHILNSTKKQLLKLNVTYPNQDRLNLAIENINYLIENY